MDAEQFERPVEGRSQMWHALKFYRVMFCVLAGVQTGKLLFLLAWPIWQIALIWLGAILLAWGAFEFVLQKTREAYQ